MKFIDTHAHLNLGDYSDDQAEVIQRALKSDIHQVITPGVTLESSLLSLELNTRYPGFFYSAMGIHPNNALEWSDKVRETFLEQAQRSDVLAIGETGLDYYWDDCPVEVQHNVLRAHIALAKETQLPLILHIRDEKNSEQAYQDLLEILIEENASSIGGVMHCFSGTLEFAQAAISLNFKIAFGGVLTFKNAKALHSVAENIALSEIVLETDSPWLTPHPHRGERNEPSHLLLVAQKLADIKGCSLSEIAQITTENANQLFKIPN